MTDGKVKVEYKCGHAREVTYGTIHEEPHYIAEMRRRIKAESKLKLCGPCHHAARKYELAKVVIDDIVGPVEAYVIAGEHWNGWEMPHFTKPNADLVMGMWNAGGSVPPQGAGTQSVMSFDPGTDTYTVTFPDMGEDCTDVFAGEDIVIDGQTLHLYGVGAGAWTWDREEIAEEVTE